MCYRASKYKKFGIESKLNQMKMKEKKMKSIYSKTALIVVTFATLFVKAGDYPSARDGQTDFQTVDQVCDETREYLQAAEKELKDNTDEERIGLFRGSVRERKSAFDECKFRAFWQSLITAYQEGNSREGVNAVKTAIDYLSRHDFSNSRNLADSDFFKIDPYGWHTQDYEKALINSIQRVMPIDGVYTESTFLTVVLRIGNANLLELLLKNSPPQSGSCVAVMSRERYNAFAIALIPLAIPGLLLAGKDGPKLTYIELRCLTAKEFAVGLGYRKGSPILSILNKYSTY